MSLVTTLNDSQTLCPFQDQSVHKSLLVWSHLVSKVPPCPALFIKLGVILPWSICLTPLSSLLVNVVHSKLHLALTSSLLMSSLEKVSPGINPLFFNQKMDAKEPEKKIPSTAAKATTRSPVRWKVQFTFHAKVKIYRYYTSKAIHWPVPT